MKNATIYLMFDGNCREAMNFYKKCFDAELFILTYGESGHCEGIPKEAHDRIMHATISKGFPVLMASDTPGTPPVQSGNNFSISLHTESVQETEKLFNALGENGKVTMPLQETFWAARFGMLTDQFGVGWMFNQEKPKEA
jgi:PhnB protein